MQSLVHSLYSEDYLVFIFQVIPASRHVNRPIFNLDQDGESENVTDEKRSVSTSSSSSSISSTNLRTLLYSNETFVTCRSPLDSFFLCHVLQNVYHNAKPIPIRWWSLVNENDDGTKIDETTRFKLNYKDTLHPDTILLEIQNVIHHPNKTISLNKQDIIETNRLLKKSINGQSVDLMTPKSTKRRRIKSIEGARNLVFSLYTLLSYLFLLVSCTKTTTYQRY